MLLKLIYKVFEKFGVQDLNSEISLFLSNKV